MAGRVGDDTGVSGISCSYTWSDEWTKIRVYADCDPEYIANFYRRVEPETSRRFRIGDLAVPSWVTKGNPRYEFLGVTRNCRCGEERMKEVVERAVLFRPTPVHASMQALLRLKARAADARTMDGHQAHPIGLLGTGELCHPETPCSLGAHRQRE